MASRMMQFRSKVTLGHYELTAHAKDEMEQDGFAISDVKLAVYNGRILKRQRRRGAPVKYVVQGKATDGRRLRLVCRMTVLKRLRVITVFEAQG